MRQEDLAAAAGVSFGTIRNYEKGRTQPSLENLRRIAEATSVDVLWLIDGRVQEVA